MSITQQQFDRLPKFAQREIETLRRKIQDVEANVASILTQEPTGVSARHGHGDREVEQHIDARSGIYFRLDGKKKVNVRVVEDDGIQSLRIMATGYPSQLVVVPQVSNVVAVEVR